MQLLKFLKNFKIKISDFDLRVANTYKRRNSTSHKTRILTKFFVCFLHFFIIFFSWFCDFRLFFSPSSSNHSYFLMILRIQHISFFCSILFFLHNRETSIYLIMRGNFLRKNAILRAGDFWKWRASHSALNILTENFLNSRTKKILGNQHVITFPDRNLFSGWMFP